MGTLIDQVAALIATQTASDGIARSLATEIVKLTDAEVLTVSMLLWCPACGERHIDEPPWDTRTHHTHACQRCGMVWRPALCNTVGVRFLPGFKNEERRL